MITALARIVLTAILLTFLGMCMGVASAEAPTELTLEQKFKVTFGEKSDTMLKIAMMESGLNPKAQGYNCFYYNDSGKRYSTFCKKEDRHKAWSWDCGVLQNNTSSKSECSKLKDVDYNLEVAKSKLETQGICAWVAAGC